MKHLEGTFAMVELAGGQRNLGITGLLETIYNRFVTTRFFESKAKPWEMN
jgi:hypothetical protein